MNTDELRSFEREAIDDVVDTNRSSVFKYMMNGAKYVALPVSAVMTFLGFAPIAGAQDKPDEGGFVYEAPQNDPDTQKRLKKAQRVAKKAEITEYCDDVPADCKNLPEGTACPYTPQGVYVVTDSGRVDWRDSDCADQEKRFWKDVVAEKWQAYKKKVAKKEAAKPVAADAQVH